MMLGAMTVLACTTPLNCDIPELTETIDADTDISEALMVRFIAALMVMPLRSSLIELPLLSASSIDPGPSLSVIFWPPGVSAMKVSCPSLSSSVTFTPLRDLITFLKFFPAPSIDSGGRGGASHRRPDQPGGLDDLCGEGRSDRGTAQRESRARPRRQRAH